MAPTTYPWTFNEEQLLLALFPALFPKWQHQTLILISQYIPDRTLTACTSKRRRLLKTQSTTTLTWSEEDHQMTKAFLEDLTKDAIAELEDENKQVSTWREAFQNTDHWSEHCCRTYWMMHKWKTFDKLFVDGQIDLEEFERQEDLRRRTGEDFSSLDSTKRWVEVDDPALHTEATAEDVEDENMEAQSSEINSEDEFFLMLERNANAYWEMDKDSGLYASYNEFLDDLLYPETTKDQIEAGMSVVHTIDPDDEKAEEGTGESNNSNDILTGMNDVL